MDGGNHVALAYGGENPNANLAVSTARLSRAPANQAMNTAMKANRNISTPPANGRTKGIMGTMASRASGS